MGMVDMNMLAKGAIAIVVVAVTLAIGAVVQGKLQTAVGTAADGNLTEVGRATSNASNLLTTVLTDWGTIIVLGLVLIAVLAPLLFALIQVGRSGGDR